MKVVIILGVTIFSLALAAPQGPRDAYIVRYDSDNIGVDGYSFAVETSDGISKQEQGQVLNLGSDNESIAVRGQYSYTGDDGIVYTVNYIADENGFRAEGAHIPH